MNDNELTKQLINLLTVEQAHISLENALKGLKPENRAKKPKAGLHSVWDELEHIRITQEDILQYAINPDWKSPSWPDNYWPGDITKVSNEEWQKTVNACIADRDSLIKIIRDKGQKITEIIPHTDSHSYLREILIAAQHNSYHIAQIVFVRKILGDWEL
ncbi:MAG TPA: DinB family protein [Ignavibacteriaceae bacterium]|nr:DinB family protein [Ignavibacteriaceae bacterium]